MGCWNATCGLTNLPIRAGDPVMGVLVRIPFRNKLTDMSGACYAGDQAWPVTAGFEGVYDDYGGIEHLVESPVLDEIEKRFGVEDADHFINSVVERDEYYYPGARWDMVDYHKSVAKSKGIEYKEPEKGPNGEGCDGLGLWMCHKSAWDKLTRDLDLRTGWKEVHPFNYYRDSFESYCNDLQESIEMEARWRERDKDEEPDPLLDSYFGLKLFVTKHSFSACIGGGQGYSERCEDLEGYAQIIEDMVIKDKIPLNDPALTAFADRLSESKAMGIVIQNLRKNWYPTSGKGSQDNPYGWYCKLINAMQEVMNKQAEETMAFRVEYEEEDEYDGPYKLETDWGW